jgi:hypothetical protein
MYKGRSQSQQRGAHYRDTEPLGPIVEKSVLSHAEEVHFAVGTSRHDEWLDSVEPMVRAFARNGFRKPVDVSRLLNKQQVRTAAGQPWTPRLAWFLLGYLYSDERKKRRASMRTARPKRRSEEKTTARQSLTKDELARRLRALEAHFQRKA